MGMGLKIEIIEAKPWPPVVPPLPVELRWYEKYWKYLALGGVGTVLTGIAIAVKKKKK